MFICLVIAQIWGGTGISISLRQKVGGGGLPLAPPAHASLQPYRKAQTSLLCETTDVNQSTIHEDK